MTRPRDVVPWPSILGAASGVAAVGLVFVGGRAMLVRQAALARRRIGKPLDEHALRDMHHRKTGALLQASVLRWSLRPMRNVIDELKRVQRGQAERMSPLHPRELAPLTDSTRKAA